MGLWLLSMVLRLGILKQGLGDEAVRDIRGHEIHVLHMIFYVIYVVIE